MIFVLLFYCTLVSVDVTFGNKFSYHQHEAFFTTEHLHDLILHPVTRLTTRHLAILLEGATCDFSYLEADKVRLPAPHVVSVYRHNPVTWPKARWFEAASNYPADISGWFNIGQHSCAIFFIRRNSELTDHAIMMPQNEDFVDWIWKLLVVNLEIGNESPKPLEVYFFLNRRIYKNEWIPSNTTVSFSFYESGVCGAQDESEVSYGTYIITGGRTIRLENPSIHATMMKSIEREQKREDVMAEFVARRSHQLAQRQFLVFHQTNIVPNYTESGYEKMIMPKWVHDDIIAFYESQYINRVVETWDRYDPLVNNHEVRSAMIELDDEIKERISEWIQPRLESWCNCSLIKTSFYGIREYYNGHVLQNHVDRLTTHVISVILQVAKNLNGGEDWPLEIIQFNGTRMQVMLQPGEMLAYESARLVHGRPKPFTGKSFANAFLHFKPTSGWNYSSYFPDLSVTSFERLLKQGGFKQRYAKQQFNDPGRWEWGMDHNNEDDGYFEKHVGKPDRVEL